MATQIIKWKATDGSEWNDEAKALERDALLVSVKRAMSPLGERYKDDGCNYSNGDGYIQHTREAVLSARRMLYELTKTPLDWALKTQRDEHGKTDEWMADNGHPSWFGRMLDGSCAPLEHAWSRLMCIDDQFREWGQPYYALNPNTGKQVRLN